MEITSIDIPDNTTKICAYAFENCDKLCKINIPSSVSYLGYGVFKGCASLKELSVPSETDIGEINYLVMDKKCMGAFTGWLNQYPGIELSFGEGSKYRFDNQYLLYAGTDLLGAAYDASEVLEIDEDTLVIAPYAFANNNTITGVSIPASVVEIYEGAFEGCTSLETIEIANPDVEFDLGSLTKCNSLVSVKIDGIEMIQNGMIIVDQTLIVYLGTSSEVKIEDPVRWIEDYAFQGNTQIQKVTIGNSVYEIGRYAFDGCSNLTTIIFEEGSTLGRIGDYAFRGSGITSIVIPNSTSWFTGTGYFYDCSNLKTIILGTEIDYVSSLITNASTTYPTIISLGVQNEYSLPYGHKESIYALKETNRSNSIYTGPIITESGFEFTVNTALENIEGLKITTKWFRNGQAIDGNENNPDQNVPGKYHVRITFEMNGQCISLDTKSIVVENGVKVTFKCNNSTYENYYISSGETCSMPSDPSITGYNFSGYWYSEGSSEPFDFNSKIYSDLTLYAGLIPYKYTVIFNSNDDSGSTFNQTMEYGADIPLSTDIFVREGYLFTKWTSYDTGGSSFSNGKDLIYLIYRDGQTITLYAQWKPINYTIVFDPNGGVGNMDTQAMVYDSPAELRENTFSHQSYTFYGWNTSMDGSGTTYFDKAEVSNLANTDGTEVTLYALWKGFAYTVIFNPNGGDGPYTIRLCITT